MSVVRIPPDTDFLHHQFLHSSCSSSSASNNTAAAKTGIIKSAKATAVSSVSVVVVIGRRYDRKITILL